MYIYIYFNDLITEKPQTGMCSINACVRVCVCVCVCVFVCVCMYVCMKKQFGVHGIPAEVVSDSGPQFTSGEFQEFAKEYRFKHTTSPPHYPHANGEAERTIQTVKNLWRKNDDKYLALLDYRKTPLPGIERSPAQLLMGRRLKNELPGEFTYPVQ